MSNADIVRVRPLWPSIVENARCEFLRLFRVPAFTISSMAFPVMFYALFGLPWAHQRIEQVDVGVYELASFGAYAVISVALFSFGVTVANDRGSKTTLLMRATPLSPVAYLTGKVIATLFFALMTLVALLIFATLTGGARFDPLLWLVLTFRLLAGVFPFITLGFAMGYVAGPSSAIGVLNLISLPMSFASGLFVPLPDLPPFVQRIAPYLPAYHFGQLAWGAVGAPVESVVVSITWLAGYTAVFFVIALRAYYREETKTFG